MIPTLRLTPNLGNPDLSNWSTLNVRRFGSKAFRPDLPKEGSEYFFVKYDFSRADSFYPLLHKFSRWVITIDDKITREQIERLDNPQEIIYLNTGDHDGEVPSLIVSAYSTNNQVRERISGFLNALTNSEEEIKKISKTVFNESRGARPKDCIISIGSRK